MAHSAEIMGMANLVLIETLLHELEKSNPGIRERVFDKAVADTKTEASIRPDGNADAILAVFSELAS
ncbi:MAG TPA: hypothetical protein VFW19_17580 [Allosphingosinicella sp.]|nr:hypothetical protein [Allosphingosinicella sp.]